MSERKADHERRRRQDEHSAQREFALSWIVQVALASTSHGGISTFYEGPTADGQIFPCNGMWNTTEVFQKIGTSFSTTPFFDPQTSLGHFDSRTQTCIEPGFILSVPKGHTYKVVTQAGYATTYMPVTVEPD